MASVTIGGRVLKVLGRTDAGGFKRDIELARIRADLANTKSGVETLEKMAEVIFVYVRDNEGVSLEWVIDHLPAEISDVHVACVEASGRKVVAEDVVPGESTVPEKRV